MTQNYGAPETFEMKKRLSLAKPGQKTEVILKTYELFIYGEAHYIF
jgi:hypothetical protein